MRRIGLGLLLADRISELVETKSPMAAIFGRVARQGVARHEVIRFLHLSPRSLPKTPSI
jgi:hypothetical protein